MISVYFPGLAEICNGNEKVRHATSIRKGLLNGFVANCAIL